MTMTASHKINADPRAESGFGLASFPGRLTGALGRPFPPLPRTEPCRTCVGTSYDRRASCRACGGRLRVAVTS